MIFSLPESLLTILEAPLPFLVGINKPFKYYETDIRCSGIDEDDFIFVDLDDH